MESTVKMNESNFSEDVNGNINFLKRYDEGYGMDICNIFEMIKNEVGQCGEYLEEFALGCSMSPVLFERKKELAMNHRFNVDSLVAILKERINNDFFLNLNDLIYSLENNDYIKK
jgi:hypothetical protein